MTRISLLLFVAVVACSGCRAFDGSPEQQVVALIHRLQGDKAGTAFRDLFEGSLAAERKPTEIRMLDSQAKAVWEVIGMPQEFEIVARQEIGKRIFQIKWVSWHDGEVPMFWNAMFIKRAEKWEPYLIFFFDDPSKAGIS
ncbi:MAG TPA: hypothetical protein VIK52_09230 [Opitutaceae bacterium]